jgi:hypothetical protein
MVDLAWPADLRPLSQSFYLQPHVGGAESPITRTRKVYGLSAPRWLTKMTFRHRAWGHGREAEKSARIEALIAEMEGGLNRVALWDFRRDRTLRPQPIVASSTVLPATRGASEMRVAGFAPNSTAFLPGDYLGGDGRPHIVIAPAVADSSGVATVKFRPPLTADVPAGLAAVSSVTGMFRLTSDAAGMNDTTARQMTTFTLEFAEDLP